MPRLAGLYYTGIALAVFGVLLYVTSVAGAFWPKATPWNDIGLYVTTITLVGFGLGALWLRQTKLHPGRDE